MAEIDSLDIKIQAEASNAEKELVALATKLGAVADRLSGIVNKANGIGNVASELSSVAKAVNSIDGDNLTSVSKSVQSLSRGFATLNKSITSITNANAGFSKAASQEADHLAKQWGITDAKAIQKMAEQLDALYNAKGADAPFKELSATIQENAKFANDANTVYSELLNTIQRINSSGNKVSLGFNPSEFINQYSSMRSTLGKAFTSEAGGIDFESWVSEVNGELGNVIPVGNTAVETFQNLVNVIAESRSTMLSFAEYAKQGGVSIEDLEYSIANAHSGMMTYEKTLGTLGQETVDNTQNFEKLATTLRQFEGIEIPDTANIANLATNIGKLGSKYVTQAATNLQTLAPAMNTFVSEMNKVESLTFNAESLSGLISAISKLGGTKATSAASNIPFIADGLKQLISVMNQLQGSSKTGIFANLFGNKGSTYDLSGLTQLVSCISKLGGTNVTNAVTTIPQITTALMQFFQEMQNAPQVSQNTVDMTNALANLATATRGVGSTSSSSMNPFLNSLIKLGDKASSVIKNLANSFLKLQVNIAKTIASKTLIGSFFNKITSGSNKASKGIQSLAYYFGKFYASFFLLRRVYSVLQEFIGYSASLTEIQNVVDHVFGDAKDQIEDFSKNSIQYFGMSELTAKKTASTFQAMGTAMGITDKQVKDSNATWSALETELSGTSMAYDNAADSVADMSLNLTKLAADLGSFFDKDYEDVADNLASGIYSGQSRVLRQYGYDLTEATLKEFALANGLDADISSMTNAQKTMLRYQYVMSRAENVQSDFLRTSTSWSNSMRVLKQNLQDLGSVIGNITIQAFKPFLIAMNNALLKLKEFTTTILNSLGKIFGWKYEESNAIADTSDDAEDLTDSLDDATDSAKALKQQLQGFDELNVITTSTSSSGTGDSDTSDSYTASTGQIVEADSLLKQYESSIDSLEKLGEYISTTISNTLGSIDWDAIYAKASGFGKGLADFMVGLFNPDENGNTVFASLGTAIAGGINTAIAGFSGWQTEFSKGQGWQNLGNGIAQMVANSIEGVKWEQMETLAGNLGSGVAKSINAFVSSDSEPIKEIGYAAAKLVKTGISFWYDYVETLDFPNLGEKIGDGINAALDEMNVKDRKTQLTGWQKLGKTLSDNISGILETLTTALDTVHWEDVGQAIADFIGAIDFGKITWNLGSLVSSLANAVYTLVSKKSTWSDLGTKIGEGINKFLKSMGTKNTKTGLTGWQALGKSLSGFIDGIVTAFVAAAGEIHWDEVGEALGESLSAFFLNDDGTINVSSVNVVIGLIAWKLMTNGVVKKLTAGALQTALSGKISSMGKITATLAGVALAISSLILMYNNLTSDDTSFGDEISASLEATMAAALLTKNPYITLGTFTLSFIIGAVDWNFDHADESGETPDQKLVKKAKEWLNKKLGKTETVTNFDGEEVTVTVPLSVRISRIKGEISDWWDSVKEWWGDRVLSVKSTFETTKENVQEWWENVKDWWGDGILSIKNKFNTIKDNVQSWWKNVKEWWGDGILAVKNKFGTLKGNVEGWFNAIKSWWGTRTLGVSNAFKTVKDNVDKWFKNVKSWWGTKTLSISNAFETTKDIVDGWWKKIKKWWGTKVLGVSTDTDDSGHSGSGTGFANGGIFSGGTWHNIPQYAAGTLNAGTVFVAGEAGAEAVAHINGKTEVLNQSQLASAIASAVVSANTQQNVYLQEQNRLLRQILEKDLTISESQIGKSARNYAKEYFNRTGNEAYSF